MIFLSYGRNFLAWVWGCARAWIEIGHRVRVLEETLAARSARVERERQELRSALRDAVAAAKAERDRSHGRIDRLDRAQQARIDGWAQQVSSQINQVYMAVAASRAGDR